MHENGGRRAESSLESFAVHLENKRNILDLATEGLCHSNTP